MQPGSTVSIAVANQFLDRLNLEPANHVIDQYNRYYLLEKECVMGSARLAARLFTPVPKLTREQLVRDHPILPVPNLLHRSGNEEPS